MSQKRGWWYTASTEDRLAQIDSAIELGMTAKQCAMNCGCAYDDGASTAGHLVAAFARDYGRPFPAKANTVAQRKNCGNVNRDGVVMGRRKARIEDAKQAYLSGEPVDMWSVE